MLHHQLGVPTVLMQGNAMALTADNVKKKARAAGSTIHPIEAHTPNQNKTKAMVREMKRMYQWEMHHSGSHLIFWDIALHLPTLKGMTPEERLKGEKGDILFLIEFQWYQRVWYIETTNRILSKDQILVSCSHMTCYLQIYTTYQSTYFIDDCIQGMIKNPKIKEIH